MKSDREHSGGAGGTVVKGCGGGANTGRARVGGGGTSPMNSTVFASLAGDRRGSGGGTAPTAPVPVPVVDPGGGGTSITVADGAPPAPESGATRRREPASSLDAGQQLDEAICERASRMGLNHLVLAAASDGVQSRWHRVCMLRGAALTPG